MVTQLITVATKDRDYLHQFRASAKAQGYELLVIGRGEPFTRFMDKIKILRNFLRSYQGPATHLFLCDAFDCWVQKPLAEVEDAYRRCGAAILISSHKRSHPFDTVDAFFPQVAGGYRYICAGVWIGEIGAVREVLNWIWENYRLEYSEQGGWVRAKISGKFDIAIDHENRLAFTVQMSDLDVVDGLVVSRATGTTPCIVHGNSGQIRMVYERLGLANGQVVSEYDLFASE